MINLSDSWCNRHQMLKVLCGCEQASDRHHCTQECSVKHCAWLDAATTGDCPRANCKRTNCPNKSQAKIKTQPLVAVTVLSIVMVFVTALPSVAQMCPHRGSGRCDQVKETYTPPNIGHPDSSTPSGVR